MTTTTTTTESNSTTNNGNNDNNDIIMSMLRITISKNCDRWIKFLEELFGNKFSLLLWAGAVLCFVGYALRQARKQGIAQESKKNLEKENFSCS